MNIIKKTFNQSEKNKITISAVDDSPVLTNSISFHKRKQEIILADRRLVPIDAEPGGLRRIIVLYQFSNLNDKYVKFFYPYYYFEQMSDTNKESTWAWRLTRSTYCWECLDGNTKKLWIRIGGWKDNEPSYLTIKIKIVNPQLFDLIIK